MNESARCLANGRRVLAGLLCSMWMSFSGCGGGCGGGTANLIDKLPATADAVMILNLQELLPSDTREAIISGLASMGALNKSKIPDWVMNIRAAAYVFSWTTSKPSSAIVVTGDFDAEAIAKELPKHGVVLGSDAVAVGEGEMMAHVQLSWDGKGPSLSSNATLSSLLGKVNGSAAFVVVGHELSTMKGRGLRKIRRALSSMSQLAFSCDVSEGVAIKGWAKGDMVLLKLAQKMVPKLQMEAASFSAERFASQDELIQGLKAFPGLFDVDELGSLFEGVREMVNSIELQVSDDTATISASSGVNVLPIVAAAIAIPSSIKARRRAKTTEAIDQIDKIYKGATVYFQDPKNDPAQPDQRLPCQFPESIPCTPAKSPCDYPGGKYPASATKGQWDAWAPLSFEMTEPHYYQYCFESSGTGSSAAFTVSAIGDLDCDGIKSTFRRMAIGAESAVPGECTFRGSSAYTKIQETE